MNNKQVDILLSVYNPNEEYLIKQLISLNNQTYPNLKLYIFDDCIKKRCNLDLFEKYITNFSYEVLPYCEENLRFLTIHFDILSFNKYGFLLGILLLCIILDNNFSLL